MADEDIDAYMPLLRTGGAIVLEGVAGIGKTHSIDKVQDRLTRDRRDARDHEVIVSKVIEKNLNTPAGNNLAQALKDVSKDDDQMKVPDNLKSALDTRDVDTKLTILVMHPSTSYEEMIGGLRPKPSTGGGTTFMWEPGKLTRAITDACQDLLLNESSYCNHLIVLDEINRCNLPSVLGELIYLIEPKRRVTPGILQKANRSPNPTTYLRDKGYSIPLGPDNKNCDLFVPSNLFFLGTMNSSDRSILGFDQALRRRFPPYRLEPLAKDALLIKFGNLDPESPLVKGVEAWASLNVLLRFVIGPDAMIGHSYWFDAHRKGGDQKSCDNAWRFGVLPQAIHAAESARKELFLAALFKADFTELSNNHLSPDDRSTQGREEAMIACGFKDLLRSDTKKDQKELFEKLHENIRTRGHVVEFAGAGHGEKLLIRKKDA